MPNGKEDTSFGDEGKTINVFDDLSYYYYFVNAAAIEANGDILFGGNLITRYKGGTEKAPLIVKSSR